MNVSQIELAFEDERGWIVDILQDEPIQHVSVLHSAKGSVRGNHVHKETFQWLFVVSGLLRYVVENDQGRQEGELGPRDMVLTEPFDKHAIEALEDTLMVVCTRGPRGGTDYEVDTYRLDDALITPSTPTS